jgi:hypothetical protein
MLSKVAFFKVVRTSDLASEKPATERTVGYNGNTELTACAEYVDLSGFDIESEGAVFELYGGNRVCGVGASDGCCGDFAEADGTNFAFPGEL